MRQKLQANVSSKPQGNVSAKSNLFANNNSNKNNNNLRSQPSPQSYQASKLGGNQGFSDNANNSLVYVYMYVHFVNKKTK